MPACRQTGKLVSKLDTGSLKLLEHPASTPGIDTNIDNLKRASKTTKLLFNSLIDVTGVVTVAELRYREGERLIMRLYDAILRRRSIRRFKQKPINYKKLVKLIDAARFAPSAANLQPWEFIIVDKKQIVERVFPHTRWAGYLKDKGAPEESRRPTVYIVALINKHKCKFPQYAQADLGAAIENVLLTATDAGLGSCWLGAINRESIAKILWVPRNLTVEYVIALGYPDERSKAEEMKKSQKYFKDKKNIMHVPKRSISQILHRNRY